MKQNCRALKLSIVLSVLFFVSTAIFGMKCYYSKEEIYKEIIDILIGLLSSTIVTAFFSWTAYEVSKKESLKQFYRYVKKLIQRIEKVEYLYCEYTQDILYNYFYQLWIEEYQKQNCKKINTRVDLFKQLLVCEKILNIKCANSSLTFEESIKIATKEVDKDIERIREESREIFQQYINLSKEDISVIDSMLDDMEFIKGEEPIKNIRELIHAPILEVFDEIKMASYIFEMHISGENNEANAMNSLLFLQKILFGVEITESEKTKCYAITNDFVNKMYMNLEELRAIIYGVEPIKLKFLPKICITINKF